MLPYGTPLIVCKLKLNILEVCNLNVIILTIKVRLDEVYLNILYWYRYVFDSLHGFSWLTLCVTPELSHFELLFCVSCILYFDIL